MAGETTRTTHRQLETLFRSGLTSGLTDGQLLDRFAGRRAGDDSGEAAFEAIVDRHGGMVLRTCRKILGDEHQAQEAAQATFLVLARRAGAVGRLESVGGWLHGVATRVASKARVAAVRRAAHERRGGEIALARRLEGQAAEDPERWVELHEELGHLPEKFRAPIVLCYLEGLTQQQAAERLRCPLGTVQSRLARGRDRLKSRLRSRGVAPSIGLLGFVSPEAAPASWVSGTVQAAIQFTSKGSEAVRAGAWPASAGLASEALRAMTFRKIQGILATGLVAAIVTAVGAVSMARIGRDDPPKARVDAKIVAIPVPEDKPAGDRTVTGIVVDDKGLPVAKVWVGGDIRPDADTWENPAPANIRERAEAFRDSRGEVIPPGAVGQYFEAREPGKDWHPVSPEDIRIFEVRSSNGEGYEPKEVTARRYSKYSIRVKKAGWWMVGMPFVRDLVRTDAEGRFTTVIPENRPTTLHFTSNDYSLQASFPVDPESPNKPIRVHLRPTRLVSARLIEVPKDDPKAWLNWTVYSVDAAGKVDGEWLSCSLPDINHEDPYPAHRRLEVRLPIGKWKVEFRSDTVRQVVDLDVPAGTGPLDLPDFRLETLETVKRIGKPAIEIEAVDLDGKAVRLADFRGKVVVLDFWATWCGPCVGAMPRLMAIRERFLDKPVVVLALHDGSIADREAYRKEVGPIKGPYWDGRDLPFTVLLDRPPGAKGLGPYALAPGEKGSGRSAEAYEISTWPSTYLIDAEGKLVGKFELDGIEAALEDQFGMPRAKPKPVVRVRRKPREDFKLSGRVVGPDDRPVAGASIKPNLLDIRDRGIKADAEGKFTLDVAQMFGGHFFLRVEAPGLAPKMFPVQDGDNNGYPTQLDDAGNLSGPLKLGVGVVVTGRVLRDGKPVVGLTVGLNQVQEYNNFLGWLDTKTDDHGRFRFDHVYANEKFTAFAETGGLKNGGAVMPRKLATQGDGTSVDLGDFEVKPGRKLAGRVVFSDGKAIPPGTTVMVTVEDANGGVESKVDPATGAFEAVGLPPTVVGVYVRFSGEPGHLPVGYRLSPAMKCVDPLNPYHMMGRLDRDVTDLTILFEPGEIPKSDYGSAALADFKDAKAGTIVGATPSPVRPNGK